VTLVVAASDLGGAQASGPGLVLWAAAYVAALLGVAVSAFRKRDL
jgi:hypothetical protein